MTTPSPASASPRSTRWARRQPPDPRARARLDPRTKAGAYGEQVKGPHKPTLDEMGPHAERGLPVAGKPLPPKPPMKTIDVPGDAEKKKHRHGRPRKTGRPGQ